MVLCPLPLKLSIATTVGGHTNCSDNDVRLVGGSSPTAGRLEICANQMWGTVCSGYYWSTSNTNAVCRQLGYQFFGESTTHLQPST